MTTYFSGSSFQSAGDSPLSTLETHALAPMRVVVFSSQKGGSGKTTLCGQLAVQAERNGDGPVAIVDTDPQGSLADWWNARSDDTPVFVRTTVERLEEDLAELRILGFRLVFVDTQPSITDTVGQVIGTADLVVIPTRPSPHDLRAVGATLDLVEEQGKPMVFAVNGANGRARITGDVAVALSQHGTVAPVTVHHRTEFATSMINGLTVMEVNPKGKSAAEIAGLWEYLKVRLQKLDRGRETVTFETPMTDNASGYQDREPLAAAEDQESFGSGTARRVSHNAFGRRSQASTGFLARD